MRASGVFEGKALGKAGDRLANAFLVDALRAQRPDDGLLSEESKDTEERLGKSRVWIVDPLDGTREYGEARPDWAVHVGLAIDGVAEIGAVALPGLDGGWCCAPTSRAPLPAHDGPPRMLVSRTRPAAEALAVAEALGGELVPMGSAGAKAMAVVARRGRDLPPLGRPVRMGQLRAGRGRPRARPALLAHRRQRAASTTTATPTCPTC